MSREKKLINIEVGRRIRERREYCGWTRDNLAEITDLSVRYLGMVETGAAGVSLDGLRLFAAKLETTADYLLNGEPDTSFRSITLRMEQLHNKNPKHVKNIETIIDAYINSTEL